MASVARTRISRSSRHGGVSRSVAQPNFMSHVLADTQDVSKAWIAVRDEIHRALGGCQQLMVLLGRDVQQEARGHACQIGAGWLVQRLGHPQLAWVRQLD